MKEKSIKHESSNQQKKSTDHEYKQSDQLYEGREDADMDIDRMVNEGLGGGNITLHNGFIDHSTTDTMKEEE